MRNNKELTKLPIIFFLVIIFVGKLLPYNYPTDIYNVFELGYTNYANTWFLTSGRIGCVITFYVLAFFNIQINTAIFILKVLSIVIATYCIYIFYKLIINPIENPNKLKEYGLLFSVLSIFLNSSTYELFYYTESAVMWLGILFVILALREYMSDSKNKSLKIIFLLFLSVNCYQAMILLFIPSILLLLFINKRDFKYISKEIIKMSILVGIDIIIEYIIVLLIRRFNTFEPFRNIDIKLNINIFFNRILDVLIYYTGNTYNVLISLFNYSILTFIIILEFIKGTKRFKISLYIIILWAISTIEVVALISTIDFYLADRIQFAYIATNGIILTYLLVIMDNKKYCIIGTSIAILLLIINILNSYNLTENSRIARKEDVLFGQKIYSIILNYEKKNNVKIKNIEYCYDLNPTRTYNGIRYTLEPTCRIFYGNWVLDNAFNYFCPNHNFNVMLNQKIYKDIFFEKQWDDFSIEQIEFNGNTMYYCIY